MRPECVETTALGAAYLCGIATGVYSSLSDIKKNKAISATFSPTKDEVWRKDNLSKWREAVRRSLGWMK